MDVQMTMQVVFLVCFLLGTFANLNNFSRQIKDNGVAMSTYISLLF